MEFTIEDTFRFDYDYTGDGAGGAIFTANAIADMDCDAAGNTTVTANGILDAQGNPQISMTKVGND